MRLRAWLVDTPVVVLSVAAPPSRWFSRRATAAAAAVCSAASWVFMALQALSMARMLSAEALPVLTCASIFASRLPIWFVALFSMVIVCRWGVTQRPVVLPAHIFLH